MGQTTRLGKTLDTIKQNVIVPMVEKVAELEANMKFGTEDVYCNVCGQPLWKQIDDSVRQGNYEYKYTDNSGIQQRTLNNDKIIQTLSLVWNDKDVPLNKAQIVKKVLQDAGIENTDNFFQPDLPNQQLSELPQNMPFNMPAGLLRQA